MMGVPRQRVQPTMAANAALAAVVHADGRADPPTVTRPRLANSPQTERQWSTDREAMRAALRVALGLPRVLPSPAGGGKR